MDVLSPERAHVGPLHMARLVELSRKLNSTTDLDTLLTRIVHEAAELVNAQAASILLLDPQTRELRFRAASNADTGLVDIPVPIDNSFAGAVLRGRRPLISDDVSQDERWNPEVAETIDFQTGSILGVPMHDVSRPVGVIEAINKVDGTSFTQEDVEILVTLADLAGVAVEKARLIDEVQQAYKQLSELDQLKNDFVAIVSHELRTPLAIIVGYVSLLQEQEGARDPDTAEQLDSVLNAALHMRDLVQDMFNLKYIDAGQTTPKYATFDFGRAVYQMVVEREEMIRAKHQKIRLDLADQRLPIRADRNMIEVILGNLLNNAAKFTPDGGLIEVTTTERGGEVWLRVRDTGIGIPEDRLNRIFDRFYQIENHMNRNFQGLGLGLAIARDLVLLHNGRIWARSTPGEGTEFFVAIPLAQPGSP